MGLIGDKYDNDNDKNAISPTTKPVPTQVLCTTIEKGDIEPMKVQKYMFVPEGHREANALKH